MDDNKTLIASWRHANERFQIAIDDGNYDAAKRWSDQMVKLANNIGDGGRHTKAAHDAIRNAQINRFAYLADQFEDAMKIVSANNAVALSNEMVDVAHGIENGQQWRKEACDAVARINKALEEGMGFADSAAQDELWG